MKAEHEQSILESERALLATMMLKPSECHRVQVMPEYFISEQHEELCRAIQSEAASASPVDPVSIYDYFLGAGKPSIGSLAVGIGNSGYLTASPEVFAHRIASAWRQRQAREIARKLIESSSDKAVDVAVSALMNLHALEQNHEWDARQATNAAFQELTVIHQSGGKLPGVTTGLRDVDQKLGGLHKGDMIVVGGRAAMGKTSFLMNMARSAALEGVPVGIISGEQPVEQIALRMLSSSSGINATQFRTAQFEDAEWSKLYGTVAENAGLPMWFLDRSAPSMAEVARVARRWKHKHGIKALYVDYMQRIGGEGDKKYEQVSFVARALKNLARDLDIPVVVLAQVSRAVEGRANNVPKMGDLSDSSEIEKEADQVLMLFREGYYDINASQSIARVIVEKNRHGPTGYVDLHWNGGTMTFGDLNESCEKKVETKHH